MQEKEDRITNKVVEATSITHKTKEEKFKKKLGPNELVQKLDIFYRTFSSKWATLDNRSNFNQGYDREIAREDLRTEIRRNLTQEVEKMLKTELDNLKVMAGRKKKTKKKLNECLFTELLYYRAFIL